MNCHSFDLHVGGAILSEYGLDRGLIDEMQILGMNQSYLDYTENKWCLRGFLAPVFVTLGRT